MKVSESSFSKTWNHERNIGRDPKHTSANSSKKYWWKCEFGHEWKCASSERHLGRGCAVCNKEVASPDYNLATEFPSLADQWGQNTKAPTKFLPNSHAKVWWRCPRGHEWKAVIQSRTCGGNGCPECSKGYKTSRLEIRVFCEIRHFFPDAKNRAKIAGKEVDVFVPSLNTAIEVDGSFWHSTKMEHDEQKNQKVESFGIKLVRIRELPLQKIRSHDVVYSRSESEFSVIKTLLTSLDTNIADGYLGFANESDYAKMLSEMANPSQNLAQCYPHLSKEWNFKRNGALTPPDVARKANLKVWWICQKGHEWDANVDQRARGSGCPYCAGKKVCSENSLEFQRPDAAIDWNFEKNGDLTPSSVTKASRKVVWWKYKNGHEWKSRVKDRTNSKGCNECRLEKGL